MYKDFDLPTNHEVKGADYIPPKARDEAEIERRHRMPRGSLMAEQQRDGIAISADILAELENKEDLAFASRILGASALNTSWYLFAEGAPVMRRRLKLPILASAFPELRPDTTQLIKERDASLRRVKTRAENHSTMVAIGLRELALEDSKVLLGRFVGNAALKIATVDLGEYRLRNIGYGIPSNFDLQDMVRRRSLRTLRDARELGAELHTVPSLAQLANPDSDLSIFWRRNAPDGALRAYESAYESFVA